jgi:hypothetical protein
VTARGHLILAIQDLELGITRKGQATKAQHKQQHTQGLQEQKPQPNQHARRVVVAGMAAY